MTIVRAPRRVRRLRRFVLLASLCLGALIALPPAIAEPGDRPRGIFVLAGLGGPQGGTRKAVETIERIRSLDYIEGATIGFSWADTEPSPGRYDFSKVDAAIAALLGSGKKLNIEIFAVDVPEHVVSRLPADEVWESHASGRRTTRTAVPWSRGAQDAFRSYLQALADFRVLYPDGTRGRLADHPSVIMVSAPILGLQDLRDLTASLSDLPGYSRERFVDAVVQSVHSSRDAFPEKFGFLGFFRMSDGDSSDPLEREVMDRMMAEFNIPGRPSLGFFQETLSDSGPRPESLGKYLFDARESAYIVFQALTAWSKPFTGAESVSSGKAATGIEFAHETYRATYVEIYLADAIDPKQVEDLRRWNAVLNGR